MSPKQKERVVNDLKSLGYTTLMCGDGTNDVGALKHAHVGVALLSHPYDATKAEAKKKEEAEKQAEAQQQPQPPAGVGPRRANAPLGARQNAANNPRLQATQARLEQMMKEMEEEEKAKVIRLGDASIAAPFTSKFTSIQSSNMQYRAKVLIGLIYR